MERLRRILAGGTLAAMLATVVTASGCRSTQNPVPPGPKYSTFGEQPSSAGFNSDPRSVSSMPSPYANGPAIGGMPQQGMPGAPGLGGGSTPGSPADGMPPGLGSGAGSSSYGTPTPGSPGMNLPTSNAYGPPATSGVGR